MTNTKQLQAFQKKRKRTTNTHSKKDETPTKRNGKYNLDIKFLETKYPQLIEIAKKKQQLQQQIQQFQKFKNIKLKLFNSKHLLK